MNPFGRYSLPNVLGRLFSHNQNPGPVSRGIFPTSNPGVSVGNVPVGGNSFAPSVNYGGNQGWQGPQPGTGAGYGAFNPAMGVGNGLDATQGQSYGAFQPQFGGGSSPGAGSYSVGQNAGWSSANGAAMGGLLGHFQGGPESLADLMRIRKS